MDTETSQSTPATLPQGRTLGERLAIPIAIVLAGILVAGSLYLVAKERGGTPTTNNTDGQAAAVSIPEVTSEDHLIGNPDAPVILVEYSDLECPYCKQFHTTAKSLMNTYGKAGQLAWAYRHFPLQELHPNAPALALISECVASLSNETSFWNFVDTVFSGPVNERFDLGRIPAMTRGYGIADADMNSCREAASSPQKERISKDFSDAVASKGRGTPHNILVAKNGWNDESHAFAEGFKDQAFARGQDLKDSIFFSEDNKLLVVEGAFPEDFFKGVLDAQLN